MYLQTSHNYNNFFTADIRNLDVFDSEVPEIPDDAVETMSKLVKKLKFSYESDTFENPFQRVSFRNLFNRNFIS